MPSKHCIRCGAKRVRKGDLCNGCAVAKTKIDSARYIWGGGHVAPVVGHWMSFNFSATPIGFQLSSWPDEGRRARMDDEFDADRAPDLIEPILAWRGWEVTPTGHLIASGVQGVWDPGVNTAVCKHAGHTEDVPAVNCGCGFYGWHEPSDVQHGQIRGAIKCWGEIIVHDVGVRAEFAEVVCLFQSTTQEVWLQRASERYGVPLVASQDEAEKLAATHGIRIPVGMRPDKSEAAADFGWPLISVHLNRVGFPSEGKAA